MVAEHPLTLFPALQQNRICCFRTGKRMCACGFGILFISLILITIGIGGPFLLNSMIEKGLNEQTLITSKNSPGYHTWADGNRGKNPVTLDYEWHFYNITNAEEFSSGQSKTLKVDELGPYIYKQLEARSNATFYDNAEKVSYTYFLQYQFDREKTPKHLNPYNDKLTMINVPLMGVLSKIMSLTNDPNDEWWKLLSFDLIATYTNASIWTTVSIQEIAYGYNDPTLEFVHSLDPSVNPFFAMEQNYSSAAAAFDDHQIRAVFTGKNNVNKASELFVANNQSKLNYWGSEKANTISGSNGYQVARDITLGSKRAFWLAQFARSLVLSTNETVEQEGVTVNRFYLIKETWSNSTEYKPNSAYYMNEPYGTVNLTSIPKFQGLTLFGSNPRFFDADSYYSQNIELKQCQIDSKPIIGYCPNAKQHQSWVDIEPISGLIVGAKKGLQFNVKLNSNMFLLYPNFPGGYIPIVWVQEVGGATQALADKFRKSVYPAVLAKTIALWVGCALGGILFLVAISFICVGFNHSRKRYRGYEMIQ